jgi:alpha,alpha-trehalase
MQERSSAKMILARMLANTSWDLLTRNYYRFSTIETDIKLPSEKTLIYISKKEDISHITNQLQKSLPEAAKNKIEVCYLPEDITKLTRHGLLYLPNAYVVPGGRFNEMYGWDSYFIELGLLENNRNALAKGMVDNFIYEINYYGTILNANRTYYLQRSQPPLLTQMILAYYDKSKDVAWLKSTLPAIEKLYQYWMSPPHLIPEIGLSRYYAGGEGAVPEESPVYYQKALSYFKTHKINDYDKKLFYNEKSNQLTPLFYTADRTVRESGFDITAKYGPFGAAIIDYVPVDLNVLLYQMEKDMNTIYTILGNKDLAETWSVRAEKRAKLINQYMWNESLGYYFDYNIKTKSQRLYVYATTFYPLWAGIASKVQAQAIINNLPNLLAVGGIVTSMYTPQLQWDAPFGWAPMQYFAVKGLHRYGYANLARETASRFVKTVNKAFAETHQLYEKYDVQRLSIHTKGKIGYSYNTNEIGFGWTNGVYLILRNYIKS